MPFRVPLASLDFCVSKADRNFGRRMLMRHRRQGCGEETAREDRKIVVAGSCRPVTLFCINMIYCHHKRSP